MGQQLQDSSTFTESQKPTTTGEVVRTGQLNFNPQDPLQKQQEQKGKPAKQSEPPEVRIFSLIILIFTTTLFATVHTQLGYSFHYFQNKQNTGGHLNKQKEGNLQKKAGNTNKDAVFDQIGVKSGNIVKLTQTQPGDCQEVVKVTHTPTPDKQKCPKPGQGAKVVDLTETPTPDKQKRPKPGQGAKVVDLTETPTPDKQKRPKPGKGAKVVDLKETPTPDDQKRPKPGKGCKVRVSLWLCIWLFTTALFFYCTHNLYTVLTFFRWNGKPGPNGGKHPPRIWSIWQVLRSI